MPSALRSRVPLALTAGVFAGLAALLAPTAHAVVVEPPLDRVQVIAHRGASYSAPEHTFPAYDGAVAAGTDFLECDLQLTRDGVLVCVHDTTVDRTTGRASTGRVDACYRRVAPQLRFHLETKAPAEYAGKMEPQLVKVLAKHTLLSTGSAITSRVLVQSFELSSLEVMARLAPDVARAYLFAVPASPEQAAGVFPSYVDLVAPIGQFVLAHPGFPALAHHAGLPVQAWTADDETTMNQLLDGSVKGPVR